MDDATSRSGPAAHPQQTGRRSGGFVASVRERHTDPARVKEVEGAVADLGEGGVFIEMPDPPPKGTILEVEFDLPGRSGRASLLGIVRWREKAGPRAGVGVRFAPIGERARAGMRELVRRGAGGSGAAGRGTAEAPA